MMKLRAARNHHTENPHGEAVSGTAVWAPAQAEGVEDFCKSETEYQFRLRFQADAFYGGHYTVYTIPGGSSMERLQEWADDHDVEVVESSLTRVYARQDTTNWGAVPVSEMWCPPEHGGGKYKNEARRLEGEAVAHSERSALTADQVGEALEGIARDSVRALRRVPYVEADDIALLRESQDRPTEPPF